MPGVLNLPAPSPASDALDLGWRALRSLFPTSPIGAHKTKPEDFGYRGDGVRSEKIAEAIRA